MGNVRYYKIECESITDGWNGVIILCVQYRPTPLLVNGSFTMACLNLSKATSENGTSLTFPGLGNSFLMAEITHDGIITLSHRPMQ